VENRLAICGRSSTSSIPDFGSSKDLASYIKRLAERSQNPYGPLRASGASYILRRLRPTRAVIADLPDKTEVKTSAHESQTGSALSAGGGRSGGTGSKISEGIGA